MIDLILAILFAFKADGLAGVCDLGEPLATVIQDDRQRDSWEQWVEQNPDNDVIHQTNGYDDWNNPQAGELTFWIYEPDDAREYVVLFVFNPDNLPHGKCAKVVRLDD